MHHTSGAHQDGAHPTAVRTLRLKPGQAALCLALSDTIRGLATHWVAPRTEACLRGSCAHCRRGVKLDWRGYFAALCWDEQLRQWLPFAVEVTARTEMLMRPQYRRGTLWHLHRPHKIRDREPPTVATLRGSHLVVPLPEPFDFGPALAALYGDIGAVADTENPMPPRVFVETTNLPAPTSESAERAGPAEVSLKELVETDRRVNGQRDGPQVRQ